MLIEAGSDARAGRRGLRVATQDKKPSRAKSASLRPARIRDSTSADPFDVRARCGRCVANVAKRLGGSAQTLKLGRVMGAEHLHSIAMLLDELTQTLLVR